ncbi:MAG TPA: hypothetical protein VF056_08940 [Thermoleophilaceae bacterium]
MIVAIRRCWSTRQQMTLQVIAMAVERPRPPLADYHHRLEPLKPGTGDCCECQPRADWPQPGLRGHQEPGPRAACIVEIAHDGPKRGLPPSMKQTAYLPFGCR